MRQTSCTRPHTHTKPTPQVKDPKNEALERSVATGGASALANPPAPEGAAAAADAKRGEGDAAAAAGAVAAPADAAAMMDVDPSPPAAP